MHLYQFQESTEVPRNQKQYFRKASIYSAQSRFPLLFEEEVGSWAPMSPSAPNSFRIFKLARFFSEVNLLEFPIQLIS